jgi:hypothetical protein
MSYIKAEPGDTIDLSLALWDRSTNKYPQAKIYDISGNLITTVNLTHVASGLYQGTYAPDGTYKHLVAHYLVYTDSGHTVLADSGDYSAVSDKIYVAYDAKPSFGGVVSEVKLSEKDYETIANKVAELQADKMKELLEAIGRKSEFDPTKDIVKTDIKIPQINLREIKDTLDLIIMEMKKPKDKMVQKDYLPELKKIQTLISVIKIPDNSDLKRGIESLKSPEFKKDDIVKIASLLGRIIKNDDLEKMIEVLNLEEIKRFQELKKLLTAIMYSSQQSVLNPRSDNTEEMLGAIMAKLK